MTYDKILVLDFGSQYNQLIARRIREMGVFSELRPHDMTAEQIKAIPGVKGIVFSGGPRSVYEADAFKCDPEIFSLGLPILGICYGMQLTSQHFGGVIERGTTKEYGKMPVTVQDGCLLFDALPKVQDVWMSHGDHVAKSPDGFKMAAVSENGLAAAIYNEEKRIYLVQFHPEVRHSVYGNDIIANFVFKICRAEKNWTMESYLDMQIAKVREQVGDKRVLCGLSGAYLSIVQSNLFVKEMVAGRGFMALAATIFGGWNPVGSLLASLLFAFAQALRINVAFNLPERILQMLPYLLTLAVLIGFGRRVQGPQAAGDIKD